MTRLMVRTAWCLALACCSVLAACAGDLENPERFEAPSTGPSCELDVMADIIEPKCGIPGCHAPMSSSAGLDLVSAGHASRLVGVEAAPETAGGACEGRVRIDPADPENSLFIEKLLPSPGCGTQMPPVGGALSDDELDCMIEWVEELAAMGGGGGGDGGVAAGDDGGSGDVDGGVTADGGM